VQQRDVEQHPSNSNDEKGDTSAKMHIKDRDGGLMGRTVVAAVHSVNNVIEASTSFSFQVNAREHDHNQTMEEMQQVHDAYQNTLPKQVNDLSLMEEAIKVSMRGVHGNAATKVLESQQTPAKEQSCMISKTSPVNLTDKDKGKAHLHDHANEHNIVHKEQV